MTDEQKRADALFRGNFEAFNAKCFDLLNPRKQLRRNWHHKAMVAAINEAWHGSQRRLIINQPPRSLKSEMISAALPAFLLGHDPGTKIIVVSYNETLAEQLSGQTRRIMMSPDYRRLFPATRLTQRAATNLATWHGGMRFATSVGGPTTGFGGDWIIIDDPHNAAEIHSEAARERVKNYFDQALSSRLDDEETGRIILVMQRLHADDLSGHLLKRPGWRHLKLPARAPEDTTYDIGEAQPYLFRRGELLHPQRLSEQRLVQKTEENGSYAVQAQYMQDPVPAGGNMIQRAWLHYYDKAPPPEAGQIVLSLDTASKTDPQNDFSVCTVWQEVDGRHYLLDVWRDKVGYPALKRQMISLAEKWRPHRILVEDQGSGIAIIQELRPAGLPIIDRHPRGSKKDRVAGSTGAIEAGQVLFPKSAPWLAEFETELLVFDGGKHDDQVDSLTQYLTWIRERDPPRIFYHGVIDPNEITMEDIAHRLAQGGWWTR